MINTNLEVSHLQSEDYLVEKCKEISASFLSKYKRTRAVFTSKPHLTAEICQILQREGLCLDVVSGKELSIAIHANFPRDQIEFSSKNASREEVEMAVDYGVGRIIIGEKSELELIELICRNRSKKIYVLLELPADSTGFPSLFRSALSSQYVNLIGFTFPLNNPCLDKDDHLKAISDLLALVTNLKKTYGYNTAEINLGGSFDIQYTGAENKRPFTYFLDPIMEMITAGFAEIDLACPTVVITGRNKGN